MEGRDNIRTMFATGFASAEMDCIVENIFEEESWDPRGLRGCGFFRFEGGLFAFQRGYWDKLSFLREQGLPLPTS